MIKIPLIHLKDKQAFAKSGSVLRFLGKPLDVARKFKEDGFKLIHIVDEDALSGLSTNLDVYNNLTFIINVQVECAPIPALVHSLLNLSCRVVLEPGRMDLSGIKEKQRLVAKILPGTSPSVDDFHDILLLDADEELIEKYSGLGKRIILYESEKKNKKAWGIILSSF